MTEQHPAASASRTNSPLFLFAPGAGAGSDSVWMRGWAQNLSALGAVELLDYPYRLAGRKAPDKLPVLIAAHRHALAAAREGHPSASATVLVGKSMGGRVGCHVALEESVDALICLGYPLRGASGAWRDEVLLALRTPILFVQGTRDPLCPLDALAGVRARMSAPSELFVVEGGNHSLDVPRPRRTRSRLPTTSAADHRGTASAPALGQGHGDLELDPQDVSDRRVMAAIAAFLAAAFLATPALGRRTRAGA